MGLGRLYDSRSTAVSLGCSGSRSHLQLVEFVRLLGRSGHAFRGDHELSIVIIVHAVAK